MNVRLLVGRLESGNRIFFRGRDVRNKRLTMTDKRRSRFRFGDSRLPERMSELHGAVWGWARFELVLTVRQLFLGELRGDWSSSERLGKQRDDNFRCDGSTQ